MWKVCGTMWTTMQREKETEKMPEKPQKQKESLDEYRLYEYN